MVSNSELMLFNPLTIPREGYTPEFKKDWDKLYKLVTNKSNKLVHLPAIEQMIDLFVIKHKCKYLKDLLRTQLFLVMKIEDKQLE